MEKIAVLLAVYNGREWIDEQLQSILEQKDVELDIHISVDLSTDGSYEYLMDKYSNLKNIFFLPYGTRFGSAGKNFYNLILNVSLENYTYISFADQDDIWNEKKLRVAIDRLNKNNADSYSGNVTAFWSSGRKFIIDKAQPQVKFDFIFEAAGPGCTYVFNKKLAKEFKLFLYNNSHAQTIELHDWALYAFARSRNYKWFIDPQPFMLYRQHDNNQVGANSSIKAWLKRINLVRSSWYRNEIKKILISLGDFNNDIVRLNIARGYFGNIVLAANICNLRRRNRDRFMLLLLLITNSF